MKFTCPKTRNTKILNTTSARLTLRETYYFCDESMTAEIRSAICGVPLESSGLRSSNLPTVATNNCTNWSVPILDTSAI